jgi:SAM-dependent methyltransferase
MPTTSTGLEFDPRVLAEGLIRSDDGIWCAREHGRVSYPEDGNSRCFDLEEDSFWFAHRAGCLRAVVERFRPPGTIVDIGGGNGFDALKLIQAGFSTIVLEPGETGARNAARRGVKTVICATLEAAHFRAASLSAAAAFDVTEHVEDDLGFLREIHRCLTPGGRLYLTVPAYRWLWSDADWAAGHHRRYTCKSLRTRLQAAGFTVTFATYFFSLLPLPLFFARSLPSLFGHRKFGWRNPANSHKPRLRSLTGKIWQWELGRLRRGRTVPFGGSCFAVAEKP